MYFSRTVNRAIVKNIRRRGAPEAAKTKLNRRNKLNYPPLNEPANDYENWTSGKGCNYCRKISLIFILSNKRAPTLHPFPSDDLINQFVAPASPTHIVPGINHIYLRTYPKRNHKPWIISNKHTRPGFNVRLVFNPVRVFLDEWVQ